MDPNHAEMMAFMIDSCNYHYIVMPFSLKNAGVTYQRLMDWVFTNQIGKNPEVYIDNMVIKAEEVKEHPEDLKDVLASIRKHDMILNSAK